MDQPESTTHSPAAKAELPGTPPEERKAGRSAMMIVFMVVFIDLLGFGIVVPLLPRYAKAFLEGDWLVPGGSASWQAGAIVGLLFSSFSLMQFIFAPIWGRLSDRVGRKPILLMGLCGSVLFYALFAVASDLGATDHKALGLALLFVARIGQGIAGATIATAQAVIADCTTPERRSRGMALIGAAFGIGFTFGPLLGAAAIKLRPEDLGAPGFAAAGLSLIALLLAVRLLPETLRAGSAAAHRRWLDWQGLRNALHTPAIGLLIIMFFLATFAFANLEATLSLLTEDALGYRNDENFLLFAYIGFMLMIAQGGFYQVLARRGVTEIAFMTMGVGFLILGMGGLGTTAVCKYNNVFGDHGLLTCLLVSLAVAVIGFAFLTPSIQALISRRSDPGKQGEILGINQSASALSRILGPLVGLSLYNVLPSHGLPYAVATGLLCLVMLMLPLVRKSPTHGAETA
jgi:MFS transporter, DHA1 family, tetracycline resistance protein